MKKKQLRKSDIRNLNEILKTRLGLEDFFDKKDIIEEFSEKIKDVVVKGYMKDVEPLLFFYGDKLLPTLKMCLKHDCLKKIVVDMGAVRFVTGGADVMRPGITEIDQGISKDDFVVVVDENNKKPLSISRALFSGDEMKEMDSGKVLKNIHFIGDDLWNL